MIVIINLLQKKCMMKTIKKGEPIPVNQFSDCVIAIGFEPMTVCLEGRCSIQLSYATKDFCVGVAGFEPATSCSQSRRDDRATLHPDREIQN